MAGIPDIQSNPAYDAQSVPDSVDWQNIEDGFSVTGIISGCVISQNTPSSMGVQITAGSVACSGVITAFAAASVTIPAASASDRRDIVIALPSGAASVVTGVPCGTAGWTRATYPGLPPVKSAIPTNCVFLGEVYVAATTVSITSANILLSGTQLLVTSQYVTSFNTRTGQITLTAADVESVFTAAGQLLVGTGSGVGELLTAGSVGTVLTSRGSASIPSWQPATGGGGSASAGVSSFNTRSGAVTLSASDIESTFTAPGQIYVGTGTSIGELLSPSTAGLVLTSNGAASVPSWQSASVVSGVQNVTATDYSQVVTNTSGSVNLHAGQGVFVEAFGADPTGTTDSTAAFNAALQAVSAASVGYVRLGVGSYLIGTQQTTTTTTTGSLSASCPSTWKMASTAGWYNGSGRFDVVTSNGVGVVGYQAISGASVLGCFYEGLGGTGSVSAGASVTVNVGQFARGQGLAGAGSDLTTINYQGPGVALWMGDLVYSASVSNAGPAHGFSINGTSSGLAGFIFGNLNYGRVDDISVSGFTNSNSGSGFYLKPTSGANYGTWTNCVANNNTDNVLIGGAHNFSEYDFTMISNANQNGFVAFSNASLVGCHIRIRGTFNTGASVNTGAALQIGGSGIDATLVTNSTYDFSVVTNGTGVAHQSLLINTASVAAGLYGTGMLSFGTIGTSTPFTAATGFAGKFGVSGYVNIPGIGLMSGVGDALAVGGGSNWLVSGGATTALTGASVNFSNGDVQMAQLASGANTWAFSNVPSSSNLFGKQVTLFVVQPSSGGAGTLTWPASVVWASGAAPVLSTLNNAIDKVRLVYFPPTNKWYGSFEPGSTSDNAATETLSNKRIAARVLNTSGPGATPTLDTDNYDVANFTAMAANVTNMSTNLTGTPQTGDLIVYFLTDNGTARTLSWGTKFASTTISLPTTTVASTRLTVTMAWNSVTSQWDCIGVA